MEAQRGEVACQRSYSQSEELGLELGRVQGLVTGSPAPTSSLTPSPNTGVIIYSVNSNISPNMSYGVLECDIMLQNYMPMIL